MDELKYRLVINVPHAKERIIPVSGVEEAVDEVLYLSVPPDACNLFVGEPTEEGTHWKLWTDENGFLLSAYVALAMRKNAHL